MSVMIAHGQTLSLSVVAAGSNGRLGSAAIWSAMNSASSLTPSDQRGAAGVLPRQPNEVETRDLGDTAAVAETPVFTQDGKIDPRVVRAVPGRPEDGVDLELAFVLKPDGAVVRVDDTRFQLDAVAALERARARPDQHLARAQPPPQP